MKKGDFIWGAVLALFAAILIIPTTHVVFVEFTSQHPYLAAFVKFSILATMGEMLAMRIQRKDWVVPKGVIFRFIIWGFLGVVITLMFQIFIGGVGFAAENGYLPGSSKILTAFFISLIMNLTFAPTFMAFHKFTDTWIDMYYEGIRNFHVADVVERIDWKTFVGFVLMKTVPFFWIPAHFITFMLPGEYRVLFAAALSLALGVLLAAKKRSSTHE